MNFVFRNELPEVSSLKPILISGQNSLQFTGREYLFFEEKGESRLIYEIRYEYHCSPFKEAMVIGNVLAVGHEGKFYLFDMTANENLLAFTLYGYFGHVYYNKELLYVTDAGGIYCIDTSGHILWQNNSLAIDGVIINEFRDDEIVGTGECDPPGGWIDFLIERKTGMILR